MSAQPDYDGGVVATFALLIPVAAALIIPLVLSHSEWLGFTLPASVLYGLLFYELSTRLAASHLLRARPIFSRRRCLTTDGAKDAAMIGWSGLVGAFLAGLLSFVSPCVLPLTPIYIAQLVGPGIWELSSAEPTERLRLRRVAFATALAFVGGFSLAFIALGATASELGSLLAGHAAQLRQVGGIVLIVLGLYVAGLLPLPWLDRTRRIPLRVGKPGYATSFVVGLIFALGWTPCVGPILAGILGLAAQNGTLSAGVLLLAVYSLGYLPFLAFGLAFDRLAPLLAGLRRWPRLIEVLTGLLLALMGVMIFMNWLLVVNSWIPLPAWVV